MMCLCQRDGEREDVPLVECGEIRFYLFYCSIVGEGHLSSPPLVYLGKNSV